MRSLNGLMTGSLQDQLVALVLAMVTIIALVAAPAGIKTPGVVPVILEIFTILMLAAALRAAKWDYRRDLVKSNLRSSTSIAAIAFFLFAAVSCFSSNNRAVSLQGVIQVGVGVLVYFVVSHNVRHTRHVSRLAIVVTMIALASALTGCIAYSSNPDGQATGLFGDHQLYGSFLMILLPFIAVLALTEKDTNRQLAAQTATVVSVIALLLAHSRSAWIGTAFGLTATGLLTALIPARGKANLDGSRKQLVPGLLMAAGILFFVLDSPVSDSFLNRAYTLAHMEKQDAWINRQQVWHGALKMIEDHPVTGVGQSMYVYSHYPYTRLGMPIGLLHAQPSLDDQTHNLYLQTAAETGIPGCLALVAVLVTFWVTGIRRLIGMERSDRRNMLLGALGATFAFAVDAIASPSWQFGQVMIFFWLALGVGVACVKQTPVTDVRRTINIVSVPMRFQRLASPLGLCCLGALMPVSVIASTRLNRFDPTTVYASVNAAVHHIVIGLLPDPVTPDEAAVYAPLYAQSAPFVQAKMPVGVPKLPLPTIDANQVVKNCPHYRLQLEVFVRDHTGVHDGGSITLDPNTHWSTEVVGNVGLGRFIAEPNEVSPAQGDKRWVYGKNGDYAAYINTVTDTGQQVRVTATYAGFKATSILDFRPSALITPNKRRALMNWPR
jgi:putative inorganic carbon (HCO3(-)) transporter